MLNEISGSKKRRVFVAIIAFAVGMVASAWGADNESAPLTFEKDIRPIFRAHCYDCHGAAEELKGGLDLRLVRSLLKGGDSGPVITKGNPEESYLLDRILIGEMPPGETKVPDQEIAILEKWIAAGAPTARPEPESLAPGLGITQEERNFWSFQPIRSPKVRVFPPEARVRTPIDALVLAAMPDGLAFTSDADRSALIRRLFFDVIGLPPSPEDVEKWMNHPDDTWYEQLVDELLASPHYGERWARHWLDIAGYADSEGYTASDADRPWAWKYRDYVIQSFNNDKPFDRFILEQLAGDELAGPQKGDLTPEQIELLTATGFLRMAADGTGSGADNPEGRNQVITDTLRIVSTSLLGLSVHCAQCHDHRYDPIPHTDYYSLRAIFEPALDWQQWKTPQQRLVSLYTAADRQRAAEIEAEAKEIIDEKTVKQNEYLAQALEKELLKYEESLREQLRAAYTTPADERTDEQKDLLKQNPSVNISPGVLYQYLPKAAEDLKKYDQRISEVRSKKTTEEFVRVLREPPGHVPETRLFHRGDHKQPKFAVEPAGLTVSAADGERRRFTANDSSLPSTGRRLNYARWLTSGQHPLVTRVLVNRIWMHHFGRGIVATPADFGKLGVAPTHPKLLDWLADEFVGQGWSLKRLNRLILLSTVWRQSSGSPSEVPTAQSVSPESIDPENRFYWRKPLVRLEAETLRDRVLASTGDLDRKLFGSPIAIKEDDAGQVIVDGDQTRRSLYIRVRRSQPVAMLQAFDAPVMEVNCEVRPVSTVATQSLILMNGKFMLGQAGKLADRATREAKPLRLPNPDLPDLTHPAAKVWQFGSGRFDVESKRTTGFKPLPHWTGTSWQGAAELPDLNLGMVFVNANGGHPGTEFAAIRRLVVPADGHLSALGSLKHPSDNGDGVRGRIVSSRSGLCGGWTARHGTSQTELASIEVRQGDTIDFMTDSIENVTSDSFSWSVQLKLQTAEGEELRFGSTAGFHGPANVPARIVRAWELALCRQPTKDELRLAVHFIAGQLKYLHEHSDSPGQEVSAVRQSLTNLCQSLMISNEFLYVD